MSSPVTVVILAAGKHADEIAAAEGAAPAGRTLDDRARAEPGRGSADASTVVVLAPDMADVAAEVERGPQPATIAFQEPQLGTGHALMVARDHLPPSGEVLVLYGDTPLLPAT